MKITFLFISLTIFLPLISAQDDLFNNPVDFGMGRTGAVTVDAWSHFSNPSGIADMTDLTVGIGYNNQYGIKEFDSKSAICIIPTKLLNIGAGYVYYGFEQFNIQRGNLSVARNIAPWLKMGMRFNYISQYQIFTERFSLFTIDAGLQLKPSKNVGIGFFAVNPMGVKWQFPDWEEYQNSFLGAALLYEPLKALTIEMGIIKNIKYPAELSFSVNVPVFEQIILRGAVMTNPVRIGFGGGFKWKPISIDLAFNHHATLGFSSSFGLLFSISSLIKK